MRYESLIDRGNNLSQRAKAVTAAVLAYATLALCIEASPQPAEASAVPCIPSSPRVAQEAGPPTPVSLGGNPFEIGGLALTDSVSVEAVRS